MKHKNRCLDFYLRIKDEHFAPQREHVCCMSVCSAQRQKPKSEQILTSCQITSRYCYVTWHFLTGAQPPLPASSASGELKTVWMCEKKLDNLIWQLRLAVKHSTYRAANVGFSRQNQENKHGGNHTTGRVQIRRRLEERADWTTVCSFTDKQQLNFFQTVDF